MPSEGLSVAQMLNAVKRCFERSSLRRENFILRRELDRHDDSFEATSLMTLVQMVDNDLGVTLLPKMAASQRWSKEGRRG